MNTARSNARDRPLPPALKRASAPAELTRFFDRISAKRVDRRPTMPTTTVRTMWRPTGVRPRRVRAPRRRAATTALGGGAGGGGHGDGEDGGDGDPDGPKRPLPLRLRQHRCSMRVDEAGDRASRASQPARPARELARTLKSTLAANTRLTGFRG